MPKKDDSKPIEALLELYLTLLFADSEQHKLTHEGAREMAKTHMAYYFEERVNGSSMSRLDEFHQECARIKRRYARVEIVELPPSMRKFEGQEPHGVIWDEIYIDPKGMR
jgi:hypothetical protein